MFGFSRKRGVEAAGEVPEEAVPVEEDKTDDVGDPIDEFSGDVTHDELEDSPMEEG